MSSTSVRLVFLWHHHQPDYRSPMTGSALLPWVRLHATKDYLDMALLLERHPKVRATFNFVPSLLDQLDAAAAGGPDALFDLLKKPVASLEAGERREIARRCAPAPRHALERWSAYRRVCERTQRGETSDANLLALETWFLLAWLDPMFFGEPAAKSAIGANGAFTEAHRDELLQLHARLVGEVIPAYRRLAEAKQIELIESAYYHPILPLLCNVQAAKVARPDLPLPTEPFAAPEDAALQLERGLERHARAFGSRPLGVWPSEGSVSPEVAAIAVQAGVKWLATDEGILWQSLPPDQRRREALYRPWRFASEWGEVALFFRDHELSDRIGFVYQHWKPAEAVADFLERVRRIGREHAGATPPVVSVILDGENCWEHYADDGGPFLDQLYTALADDPLIQTVTPSEVLAAGGDVPLLPQLHAGSWINADFRIWIGHPEKNRAWELLARTRRALVEAGTSPSTHAPAWEALFAAEGSDWFWWFGEDHYTPDKPIFDGLFREHLQGAHERAGLAVPGWLNIPIARLGPRRDRDLEPVEFIRPTIDGTRTDFYEWHGAGRYRLGAGGGSMHRGAGFIRDLFVGFDAEHLYLRLDFVDEQKLPGAEFDFRIDVLAPVVRHLSVRGLTRGTRPVTWGDGSTRGDAVPGARCHVQRILELAVPFASLGLEVGFDVEMLGQVTQEGRVLEIVPADDLVRFTVPHPSFESAMWSA